MSSEDSIELLHRFQSGDESAARELFDRYFERLDRFAERRMSSRLQRRVGSDDVAQSVYRSFFRKIQEGVFELKASGELWKLLAYHAVRKIKRKVEFNQAGKRSMSVEHPFGSDSSEKQHGLPPDTRADDPEVGAMVDDSLDFVLRKICPEWKRVQELSHEKHDLSDIADLVGASITEVRRVLILRIKATQYADDSEIAELLDCSKVTVRRLWRELLELARSMADS